MNINMQAYDLTDTDGVESIHAQRTVRVSHSDTGRLNFSIIDFPKDSKEVTEKYIRVNAVELLRAIRAVNPAAFSQVVKECM